jgi:hypothetical protein
MIMDAELELSNAQVLTATALSTNVIDLGPNSWAGNSMGLPDSPPIGFKVDTTFTAAGAATLQIEALSSAANDLSSPNVHYKSDPIPVASLVAGADLSKWLGDFRIPVLSGRYFGLRYTVATGPFTAGAITARGMTDMQTNR